LHLLALLGSLLRTTLVTLARARAKDNLIKRMQAQSAIVEFIATVR